MTLRRRLTISYAVILSACLLVMGAAAYFEFVIEYEWFRHEPDYSMTQEVVEVVAGVGLPAVICGVAGGWWLVRRSLRPIADLTEAAERLNAGNQTTPLPRSGNGDEIDRLSEVLNEFTERLNASVNQMRDFTLHASHELKTPLTIMRGEIETVMREDGARFDIRSFCASQLEEIRRLSRIVEGLTLLAKADADVLKLERKPVSLHDLVREAADNAETLSDGYLRITLASCEECSVTGDRDRLRQLLLNLTDNAIKFNKPDGFVTISLKAAGENAVISISNPGDGLTAEQCGKVFDRFYRADHSREGAGLGLSLCRWIAEAHGGTISLTSEPGGITLATVAIPRCTGGTDREAQA